MKDETGFTASIVEARAPIVVYVPVVKKEKMKTGAAIEGMSAYSMCVSVCVCEEVSEEYNCSKIMIECILNKSRRPKKRAQITRCIFSHLSMEPTVFLRPLKLLLSLLLCIWER